MAALIIAAVAVSLSLLGAMVAVVRFATRVDMLVRELKRALPMVKTIPVLTYRVGFIEKHLAIPTPDLPSFSNGSAEHDGE